MISRSTTAAGQLARDRSYSNCRHLERERFRALLEHPLRAGRRSAAWLAFVYAPFSPDWWLPAGRRARPHVVSTFGREIDSLFMIILWITGIVFIGTQIVLVWAAYRFADELDAQGQPGPQGPVLPRQPAARGDLDDHPGRHPGLHRPLPDGDLGRASSSAARPPRCRPLAEITAPAVPVGDALPRPRRQAQYQRRPVHRQ